MALFASSDDLAARLGVTLTSGEQSRADELLTLVSGLVQREARQRIELVINDVLTVPGTPDTRFRLPERPIVAVTNVTVNGLTVTPGIGSMNYSRHADYLSRPYGWGIPEQSVVVTYTHGYAEIPDAIKAVCLEAVVRAWVNPGNVLREVHGSEMTMYAAGTVTPTGLLLTAEEQRVVHDTIRRPAGSTVLR